MTVSSSDLAQFTGSEKWFRHGLMRHITYTEGVQYLAENAKAYWLIDKIATMQLDAKIKREEFQVWKLDVTNSTATLTCTDGNEGVLHSEHITFTDFPLDHIEVWCEGGVILLPSEH